MEIPNIKGSRAIYLESKEARAVIIQDVSVEGALVVISIQADPNIFHMRTWLEDKQYKSIEGEESSWKLSCSKESVILHEDFAQGPSIGWQLLIDQETVELFSRKDDSWVENWF